MERNHIYFYNEVYFYILLFFVAMKKSQDGYRISLLNIYIHSYMSKDPRGFGILIAVCLPKSCFKYFYE